MPATPSWYGRVPAMIQQLRHAETPAFVDRAAVEGLFGVRRRRAQQLMQRLGGFQAGKTWLVDRAELVAALERVSQGEAFAHERRRKTRVVEALEAARRDAAARGIRIAAPRKELRRLVDLPPGIQLSAGELRIEFEGAEDLLRRLLELAQAISGDYARFEALVERL